VHSVSRPMLIKFIWYMWNGLFSLSFFFLFRKHKKIVERTCMEYLFNTRFIGWAWILKFCLKNGIFFFFSLALKDYLLLPLSVLELWY
jgi:hypothetical protein